MSYQDLLALIYQKLPELRGQLDPPQVVYIQSEHKVYITFYSRTLVDEKAFLTMERVLRECFPAHPLALRVKSPSLKEAFLEHIEDYKQVLVDFLRRNFPASSAWISQIDWHVSENNLITLTFPDSFSMDYMARQNIRGRLVRAILDIFDKECRVDLAVAGDQEKRIRALREENEAISQHLYTIHELDHAAPPEKKVTREPREDKPRPVRPRTPKEPEKPRDPTVPEMTDNAIGKPIMGRSIADHPMEMKGLNAESGLVVVQGDIFKFETKELKGGEMLLVTFAVTDYTSSILCKVFMRYRRSAFGRQKADLDEHPITEEERNAVMEKVKQIQIGMNVKLRGECMYDNFAHELSISVRDLVPMEKIEREDNAAEKRIELHLHTNMSTLDALSPAEDLIGRAIKWGHPAIAITDHGVLQSFPAAFKAAKGKIKLIPGCEGYLIDEPVIVRDASHRPFDEPIIVLDFETTGLNTGTCRAIEIGAVRLVRGAIEDSLSILINPHVPIPPKVSELTGITDNMLADKESAETVIPKLMEFIGDAPIAAHNAAFDSAVLQAELRRLGLTWQGPVLDTLAFARKLYPDMKTHKLGTLCKRLGVSLKNAHRAVHDATATAHCLARMYDECKENGMHYLDELDEQLKGGAIGESYHIILLAKSQTGLVNLNRLVSISHLDYFRRRPHMPRSMIQKYREGLILGSACEAGELFRAVLRQDPWDKLKEMASFYDYLEIQPIGNNAFLIREGQVPDENALRDLNRQIVRLGEELGIPVVATGDVHFMDPHNAINRAIIQAGMGFEDCDNQPPLYFKTTDEMLEEFSYLGPEKCHEVVIDNPHKIADMVEPLRLFPKHPKDEDTFQPVWEDAADNIQNMTWNTAKELYGDPLPEIVLKRLEKELKSIVGYGYCTLYNIAEKLVSKSLEDGYLVGSRGSVGSSLVARMCGITEVNALPPHYRCIYCHHGFFDVDKSKYHVGVDLPDRNCPICGRPLVKDGFDIPFEVFLGFEGDKVPDIDLNFSGEYQNKAHHYVEELFGHDHVFRAGTISSLADKTAFGYVSRYMEERGIQCGNTEKDRLAIGCTGVKRTTGQHPGGMVVVPKEYEIYQFTAVQHPADDLESDFTTTHFDFNSMHDILVKLDCLGHDDPTMMHMLEELTGINFKDVPLDDWGVRSLFHTPDALGVTEDEILCNTGTYGVPEFGTAFVRGMLDETQPDTMEELLRISGLSHGTDVWLGNAQELIASGTATLSECVCCRDDIKYMFPKGHAVAYVTMSLRVAWYKLHFPSAYYCSYFTVRGDGFDAGTMLIDPDTCRARIREIRNAEKPSAKEKEQQTSLELVLEMNMRGIRFLPVDLYKSDVRKFKIEGGDLRCPFTSLVGLGESVAESIVAARNQQPFVSIEDLQNRGHVGASIIEMLRQHGTLEGLDETSQISMF